MVSACRTPIGRTAGSLSKFKDVQLMALTLNEAIRRINTADLVIDSSYVGSCFPQESYNLARKSTLNAGISVTVPGATINRTCSSSMEAIVQGARQIMVGDANTVLVGGVEIMSSSPHVMRNAIKNARSMVNRELPLLDNIKIDNVDDIGFAIEYLARKYNISRKEQDDYAILSHRRATNAIQLGHFKDEMFPINISENGMNAELYYDENVNQGLNELSVSHEKPIFARDGTVTKFNASSINDGASAMVLMSEYAIKKYNIKPLAEYLGSDVIGVSPENMGIAPALVIRNILKKQKLSLKDIDLIECNEAYAAQLLACQKILDYDMEKININGGSIALGHPLGCSGIRICVTLIYTLQRKGYSLGLASMCAGGGMGQVILFRNCWR